MKVASCSVVILTVLLASVTLPAFAADVYYKLDDYFYYQSISGDNRTIWFKLPIRDPYIKYYTSGQLTHSGYFNSFYFNAPTTGETGKFEVYPLGYEQQVNTYPYALIDVRSFNDEATFSLTANFVVQAHYSFMSEAAGEGTLEYKASWRLYMFNDKRTFVSLYDTPVSSGAITLPQIEPGTTETVSSNPFLASNCRLVHGCAYIVPVLNLTFVQPNSHDGAIVKSVSFQSTDFNLGINRSMIAEQSALLDSIDDKLTETNDHLGNIEGELSDANTALSGIYDQNETIINGTDEQRENLENFQDEQQTMDEDFQDALANLNQYTKFETGTVFGAINDFLKADGWRDIQELIEPLLEWPHTATMMLFILAFATLRVLLLGR